MRLDRQRYIKNNRPVVVVAVDRLGPCPHGGWCTSQCAYDGHRSPWKRIVGPAIPDGEFFALLALRLMGGDNHRISVSGYATPTRTFDGWSHLDYALDLADEDVPQFVDRLRTLLRRGYRLRLYGDRFEWMEAVA